MIYRMTNVVNDWHDGDKTLVVIDYQALRVKHEYTNVIHFR